MSPSVAEHASAVVVSEVTAYVCLRGSRAADAQFAASIHLSIGCGVEGRARADDGQCRVGGCSILVGADKRVIGSRSVGQTSRQRRLIGATNSSAGRGLDSRYYTRR